MNETEKKISEIVENYWGLTKDSIDRFNARLSNERQMDPVINDLFATCTDGRLRFKLPSKYKEQIDDGWKIFKDFFAYFVREYKVTYEDFYNNRVLVGKNVLKMKKALMSYYLKNIQAKGVCFSERGNFFFPATEYVGGEKLLRVFSPLKDGSVKTWVFREATFKLEGRSPAECGVEEVGSPSIRTSSLREAGWGNDQKFIGAFYFNSGFFSGKKSNKALVFYDEKLIHIYFISTTNWVAVAHSSFERTILNGANKVAFVSIDAHTFKLFFADPTDNLLKKYIVSISTDSEIAFRDLENLEIEAGEREVLIPFENKLLLQETGISSYREIDYLVRKEEIKEYLPLKDGAVSFLTFGNFNFHSEGQYTYISRIKPKEEREQEVDREITKKLERVGTVSLPKTRELELVLSINFADWFLCSTAESWSSCLNLESNFSGSHYQGIPSLLMDKFRMMIYITDGNKKEYLGIESEKVLSRAWALLDKKQNFNLLKFYPLQLFSAPTLSEFCGVKFFEMDQSNFISYSEVEPLYFPLPERSDIEVSSYIFNDYGMLANIPEKGLRIIGKSSGHHNSFLRKAGGSKNVETQNGLFSYNEGFKRIVERGIKLSRYIKNVDLRHISCNSCGTSFLGNDLEEFRVDGERLCKTCYDQNYIGCECCGRTTKKSRMVEAKKLDGSKILVCQSCSLAAKKCACCKEKFIGVDKFQKVVPKNFSVVKTFADACPNCVSSLKSKGYIEHNNLILPDASFIPLLNEVSVEG